MHRHSLDGLIEEYSQHNSVDWATDKAWNDFGEWLNKKHIEIFKCSDCGEKYNINFTATNDTSICRWCSGEEK